MAATYNPSRATAKDRVRAALGDTVMATALLQDEEIAAVLLSAGNEAAAVSQLAGELVMQIARKPVRIVAGDVTVDYKERLPVWQALAARAQITTGGAVSSCAVPTQWTW